MLPGGEGSKDRGTWTKDALRWVAMCLVLGAFLRLFRIGNQSLWIDELISVQLASWADGREFWLGLLRDIHGPLTSLLLHGWMQWGTSETWMRLLYAIPAVATIPVIYRLGENLAGPRVAKMASLALTLSPFHVWYSQEVRNYSFLIFFAAASTLVFLKALDGDARKRTLFSLAALLCATVLTNFSGAFLLAAFTVLMLVRRPWDSARLIRWGGVLALVGLVFLPWFVDWYGRIGGERVFVNAPSPLGIPLREAEGFSWAGIPYALWTFAFGYSLGPSLYELHLDRSLPSLAKHAPVFLLGFVSMSVALWVGLREIETRGGLGLVTGLLLLPLALVVLLSIRDVKTFHPRYLLVSFPVFLVVVGAGWSQPTWISRASAGVALGLALWALGNHYFATRYAKEDSRAAAEFIRQREEPRDAVVVIYSYRPFEFYFAGREGGQARLLRLHKRLLKTAADLEAHAADAASSGGRVWLVLSRWWDVAPEDSIRAAFEKNLHETSRQEFPGIKVTLYEKGAG